MQKIATIVQFKHETSYKVNDVIRNTNVEYEYKIVFSKNSEYIAFFKFVKENKGKYLFNKSTCVNDGVMPSIDWLNKVHRGDYCWCDIMESFLLERGYILHSVSETGKFKTYSKYEL